ncbi:MAG: hypothetical protein EWM47_01075 [Anaerolineaceae bacterium]|nr:MAG: hypothetical protein EWM47_01075 [Anaerolineaceae bacterium]
MNKKSVLGLLLFSCVVIAGMFLGTMLMIGQQPDPNYNQNQQEVNNEATHEDSGSTESSNEEDGDLQDQSLDIIAEDEWYYSDATAGDPQDANDVAEDNEDTNSSETDDEEGDTSREPEENLNSEEPNTPANEEIPSTNEDGEGQNSAGDATDPDNGNTDIDTIGGSVLDLPDMQLISDSNQVDYMKHIPDMIYDSKIEVALDIVNPVLDIKAKSAILLDANTGEVLYYKDPVIAVFPASTSKLLTALVALDWCMEEEEVIVGDELDLVASDSTLARLKKGQVLTIRNLLEGMLVPSGNDAAYVLAAYVGRKSLMNESASIKEAIPEFIKLMNNKAKSLGAVNSNFKTPDGYDALGQYTTAYDMGMIGIAAADSETILEICNKSSARNVFVDGFDVTWSNTNSLIVKESGRYYPYCQGLKTGTSTMAGRCLISVAKKDDKVVVSVIMNSDSVGRWEDSTKLLKYGLGN